MSLQRNLKIVKQRLNCINCCFLSRFSTSDFFARSDFFPLLALNLLMWYALSIERIGSENHIVRLRVSHALFELFVNIVFKNRLNVQILKFSVANIHNLVHSYPYTKNACWQLVTKNDSEIFFVSYILRYSYTVHIPGQKFLAHLILKIIFFYLYRLLAWSAKTSCYQQAVKLCFPHF